MTDVNGETDATALLDVVHKYVLDKPKTAILLARGSVVLCAKAQPDGTIVVWARRPVDEKVETVPVGVWVVATGEVMPKGTALAYLDTVTMLAPPSIIGGKPSWGVFHVFLMTETLLAGDVMLAR